jgi:predicted transcriptional regulator
MNRQFLQPQEIEVFYVLPAIRRYLVQFMKERGLKQIEIAKLLEINEATISQYLSEKRGHQIDFKGDVLKELKVSAERIRDRLSLLRETQRLLTLIRQTNVLCQVHRKFSNVPSLCQPDTVGCMMKEELVHVTTKG